MNLLEMFYEIFTTFPVASLVLSTPLASGHCAAWWQRQLQIHAQKACCGPLIRREGLLSIRNICAVNTKLSSILSRFLYAKHATVSTDLLRQHGQKMRGCDSVE